MLLKNKTTHSYTIEITINAAVKFVAPLFLVLQEFEGQFAETGKNIYTIFVYEML